MGFVSVDAALPVAGGEVEEFSRTFQTVKTENVLVSALPLDEDTLAYHEVDAVGMVDGDPATVFFARRWWIHGRKGTAAPALVDSGAPFAQQETGAAFTAHVWYVVELPTSGNVVRVSVAGIATTTVNWIVRVQRQRLKR